VPSLCKKQVTIYKPGLQMSEVERSFLLLKASFTHELSLAFVSFIIVY